MDGITLIKDFIPAPASLFTYLEDNVTWDTRMAARKTASYGIAYNYSQIDYPDNAFLPALKEIALQIKDALGFEPNNCLINYYSDGKSKMGFHSDQTDILFEGTGIVIVSVGETRTLRFRNILDHEVVRDFDLPSGSLIYMTQEVQSQWQHAIPTTNTSKGRISITFRKIRL